MNTGFLSARVFCRKKRRIFFIFLSVFLCFYVSSVCIALDFAPSVLAAGNDQFSPLMAQAYRYYNGIGRPVNYTKALRLYLQIARQGDPRAQFVVGGMYYKGQGTEPDHRLGFFWLLKADEQGVSSPESLSIIGTMYLQGIGVPQNYQEAWEYLKRAADLGDVTAKKNLAYMYYNGLTGKPDYEQALQLYKEAAFLGDEVSQSNVGMMYAEGMGAGVDRVRAYAWYSLAASQGNLAAVAARNTLMLRMNWQELNRAQALSVRLFKEMESNREVTDGTP